MPIDALLNFLREADRLKSVERKSLIHSGGRLENSAEHSWHLALAVLAFHPYAESPVNLPRALQMALLHDLVEIDAGDTFVYGDQSNKWETESAAAKRIFGMLPQGQPLERLWREFEAKACPESVFVGALDRFLPVFSNLLNKGHAWREHGVTLQQVLEKNRGPISAALPKLWAKAAEMLEECAQRGEIAR